MLLRDKMIYLDNAATTRVDPVVLEAMIPFFSENYANAYSIHSFGIGIREKIERERERIASFINCDADEIIFTSGATESNNLIINNYKESNKYCDINTIITTKIEHDSVLNTCRNIEGSCEVIYLDVDKDGMIDLSFLEDILSYKASYKDSKILVSIMFANNEIGSIQPIEEIGKICKKYGANFHTDATQAISTIEIDVKKMGIDFMSFSAHKFYGPKGIGVCYINKDIKVTPFMLGGEQEFDLRAGTTNVPGIIGMGKAIELLMNNHKEECDHIKMVRDYFIYCVLKEFPECELNGSLNNRVIGNANICFRNINGAEALLMLLDHDGIMASMASACNSSSLHPSHVLKAIGLTDEAAMNSIRFSFGKYNTISDVRYTIESLKRNLKLMG